MSGNNGNSDKTAVPSSGSPAPIVLRPSNRPRFRTGLLLLITLIVLPAFALLLYGNLQQRRMHNSSMRESALAMSRLAAAIEKNYVKNTQQLLSTLTQFPFLLLATDRPFCETHLFNLRSLSPDYGNFGLIEADGTLFCSAERTNAG